MRLFEKPGDSVAFERVLGEARNRYDMHILAFCVMPNHWHLVVWPRHDGELSEFAGWLTLTHTQRWHAHIGSPLGPGMFTKVASNHSLFNPTTISLHCFVTSNGIHYGPNWSARPNIGDGVSLWHWSARSPGLQSLLCEWPVPRTAESVQSYVNGVETESELAALRHCIDRGLPFGRRRMDDKNL